MSKIKLFFALAFLFFSANASAQLVTTNAELSSAVNAATPGTTIVLADGVWFNAVINMIKNGTASNPITITAQTVGSVFMTGNSRVELQGSYLTVSGLVFENPGNLFVNGDFIEPVLELRNCNYCKILNNKIDSFNGTEAQKTLKFKWVLTEGGQYNEIAHNSFIGKYGLGSIINTNRSDNNQNFLEIHHNYFADRTPINGFNDDNDQDAIRIGVSTTSLTSSFTEVYDNYFHNFFGEIEVISNKSGQNKYYNNTFRDYSGTLTLRHGDNCEVYGNYFFAEGNFSSGGVRVIGEGHKVYNNYIDGINSAKSNGSSSNSTGGINVSNGVPNSPLNEYFQVKNAEIVNNTFVNCDVGLRVGTSVNSSLTLAPENLTVANNIMYNTSINPYLVVTAPTGNSVNQGNQLNLPTGAMSFDGNFHRITSGSSPIDASVGNYAYVNQDVLDGARDANVDAGAEEFGGNGTRLPYTAADVGVNVGFTQIVIPALSTSTAALNLGICGTSSAFDISANIDWTITESLPWLSLSATSGTGAASIIAAATENTSGAPRTGNITVSQNGGGVSSVITVTQTNSLIASEIPIVGSTSIGALNTATVAEVNAYDDDFGTFWTGNPDSEPEVSITFDLGAPFTLDVIGIHFWDAQLISTSFKVSVADNPTGPFTQVIFFANSAPAAAGITVTTEQPFSLNGVTARYVKFIGTGNSSSNNFTTIANVNIYGNCIPGATAAAPQANVKAALQGPMQSSGMMNTSAAINGLVPLTQPYNVAPYNYAGTESVAALPSNVVDWVLLELRNPSNAAVVVESRACFIKNDGSIVDLDGTSGVSFNAAAGNYHVSVNHKSHLGIVSIAPVPFPSSAVLDLTASLNTVLGTDQLIMEAGIPSMKVGDFDGNNTINFLDFLNWFATNNILNAYLASETNLDGTVNFLDFLAWFANNNALGVTEMQ